MCNTRTCGNCQYGSAANIRGNGITEPSEIKLIRCKFDQRHLKHCQDICDHAAAVESYELTKEVYNADRMSKNN